MQARAPQASRSSRRSRAFSQRGGSRCARQVSAACHTDLGGRVGRTAVGGKPGLARRWEDKSIRVSSTPHPWCAITISGRRAPSGAKLLCRILATTPHQRQGKNRSWTMRKHNEQRSTEYRKVNGPGRLPSPLRPCEPCGKRQAWHLANAFSRTLRTSKIPSLPAPLSVAAPPPGLRHKTPDALLDLRPHPPNVRWHRGRLSSSDCRCWIISSTLPLQPFTPMMTSPGSTVPEGPLLRLL